MKKIERRVIVVNIFGVVGYTLLMTTWALFVGLAVVSLFEISPASPETITCGSSSVAGSITEPSELLIAFSYLFTAVVAIVTVGIFITFPYFLAKWLARTLRWGMDKLKIETSRRHLFLAKSILATLPLLGFLGLSTMLELVDVLFSSVYIATVGLTVIVIGSFLIQLVLARRLRVPAAKTW